MDINPKENWKVIASIGGLIVGVIVFVSMPFYLALLSFFYKPLVFLLVFFIILVIAHLFLSRLIYKTFLKEGGVVILYTLVIDSAILILNWHFDIILILAPIMVILLIGIRKLLEYLINYHIKRNILSKQLNKAFIYQLRDFEIELSLRDKYNRLVYLAFGITGFAGYFAKWNTTILMLKFTEISFLLITCFAVLKIIIDSKRIFTMFDDDFLPSMMKISSHTYNDNYILTLALRERMELRANLEKEEIIDYFDRAGELRKLSYYNSLSLLFVAAYYMALYTILPNPLFNISLLTVMISSCTFGLAFIQIPYFIGQKKLQLSLIAKYSGSQYREMLELLGMKSPAWVFIPIGEILGSGLIPALLIGLIQLIYSTLK
jgi:hypothetical protein